MNATLKAIKKLAYTAVPASLMVFGLATGANAAAIIDNDTIQLGVDTFGQLNVPGGSPSLGGTSTVGLRFLPTGAEATAPGAPAEGWGVADAISGLTGFANNFSGTAGLTGVSFTSDETKATSVVTAAGIFKVTHAYTPTATPFLYTAKVTIENISSKATEVLYRRVMDWDIEPTPFSEVVTIQGTEDAANVTFASNDGFASSNPLAGPSSIGGFTGDFVDVGPFDHGALFDFNFGDLAAGASYAFNIFYGGAPTEKAALEALAVVDAEVYSFGQTSSGGASGEPNTFMFAFSGVGGDPIVPDPNPVPTPALLPGLIGMGVAALRKRGQEKGESAEA